jgi:transcriptional regulator with XRE-family HTH domain
MAQPRWDIFLKEWLKALEKRQADVVRDLGWNKAKVSLIASGQQPYYRDDINELAEYLNLRPYELLMHPDDAFGIRRLRAEMIRLAHEAEETPPESGPKKVSLN